MLINVSGESAMPCMWDDCEFWLESRGNPPVQTLVRSGTCSDSWIVYDLGCPDGTKCGATRGNKCSSGATLCNAGSYWHCQRWGGGGTCGGGGPGLCSNGSPCSPTTETGQQPNLTDPYGAQSVRINIMCIGLCLCLSLCLCLCRCRCRVDSATHLHMPDRRRCTSIHLTGSVDLAGPDQINLNERGIEALDPSVFSGMTSIT